MDRCGTGPRSFSASFWNPGVETEKTAKKRRKNEQKWARYGLTQRVRAADLFVTDRYMLLCGYPPFPGDGAEAIANVQSGKYSFPEK